MAINSDSGQLSRYRFFCDKSLRKLTIATAEYNLGLKNIVLLNNQLN